MLSVAAWGWQASPAGAQGASHYPNLPAVPAQYQRVALVYRPVPVRGHRQVAEPDQLPGRAVLDTLACSP